MNEDLAHWNKIASEWSEQVVGGHKHSPYLVTRSLKQMLPDLAGRKILDAGCGDGYYTKILNDWGAGEVLGVDGSPKMIELAQAKFPNLNFEIADLLQPWRSKKSTFDFIVANLLFNSLSDLNIFLTESNRVLKKQGGLIVSVLHPTFNSTVTRLTKSWWAKLSLGFSKAQTINYFDHSNQWRKDSKSTRNLPFYHRTLEEYSQAFKQAGFKIDEMLEPHELPSDFLRQNPKLEYATRLPRFLFFKLVK